MTAHVQMEKRTETLALTQGSMTITYYEAKFQEVSIFAPGLVAIEEGKIYDFQRGLNLELMGPPRLGHAGRCWAELCPVVVLILPPFVSPLLLVAGLVLLELGKVADDDRRRRIAAGQKQNEMTSVRGGRNAFGSPWLHLGLFGLKTAAASSSDAWESGG
ncbi:hypothetical protein Droror1_Dr00015207 [Drosera rotundifolia]